MDSTERKPDTIEVIHKISSCLWLLNSSYINAKQQIGHHLLVTTASIRNLQNDLHPGSLTSCTTLDSHLTPISHVIYPDWYGPLMLAPNKHMVKFWYTKQEGRYFPLKDDQCQNIAHPLPTCILANHAISYKCFHNGIIYINSYTNTKRLSLIVVHWLQLPQFFVD